MGRLIDADALKAAMKAVKSGLDFPLSTYLKRIIAMILDGVPTVEAIPVEWIKHLRDTLPPCVEKIGCEAVLTLWEDEQEG